MWVCVRLLELERVYGIGVGNEDVGKNAGKFDYEGAGIFGIKS